jgi:hypothetical protein
MPFLPFTVGNLPVGVGDHHAVSGRVEADGWAARRGPGHIVDVAEQSGDEPCRRVRAAEDVVHVEL